MATASALDLKQRILTTIEDKQLSMAKAALELGVSRQTLYSWCGPHSSVPPSPEKYKVIAEFISEDPGVVREHLLRTHGYLDADEYIKSKTRRASASLRRRNSAIPGYVSLGGHRPSLTKPHRRALVAA